MDTNGKNNDATKQKQQNRLMTAQLMLQAMLSRADVTPSPIRRVRFQHNEVKGSAVEQEQASKEDLRKTNSLRLLEALNLAVAKAQEICAAYSADLENAVKNVNSRIDLIDSAIKEVEINVELLSVKEKIARELVEDAEAKVSAATKALDFAQKYLASQQENTIVAVNEMNEINAIKNNLLKERSEIQKQMIKQWRHKRKIAWAQIAKVGKLLTRYTRRLDLQLDEVTEINANLEAFKATLSYKDES